MAIFRLIVNEEKSPAQSDRIIKSIKNLQSQMKSSAHYSVPEDRQQNINKTIGLIQPFFVKKEPPALGHGPGLIIDLENSIRRSKVETSRYECKQGFVDLTTSRNLNTDLYSELVNTICGIANVGPESDGYMFIGVADKPLDANKIEQIDGISPVEINARYIVGVDRELPILDISLDTYIAKIVSAISDSDLSNPLKSQVLSQIDNIQYRGFSVIRIKVPKQKNVSYVGDSSYGRKGSSTYKLKASELISLAKLF
jgi:hypothetical protein